MAIHEECGVFGVMSTKKENVAGIIGVDFLGYLEVDKLSKLTGSEDYCAACFHGEYSTKIPKDPRKDRFERKLSRRV